MALFGQKKNDTADDDAKRAAQAKFEQKKAELERLMASPADLATELMPAVGPDGPRRGDKPLEKAHLLNWLRDQHELSLRQLLKYAGNRQEGMYVKNLYRNLDGRLLEAVQLLQHAELIYESKHTEVTAYWSATQSGLAALANGDYRQRIQDRTNAAPASAGVAPPLQSTTERLQELEALRATGVISDAEYTAKREQIIGEI
jgi:hypothetical protein